jgi:uncharacterized protein (DUF2249 family)
MIRRTDRIADVIAGDPGLLEVLAGAAPPFERLRNPAMRRVMARLVTVEQAARIGGMDADELVARLNAGTGARSPEVEEDMSSDSKTAPATRPAALDAVPPDRLVDLDVRDDLRSGREPFSRIMAARRDLPEGAVLRLRAIFEPVPLYEVFRKQGFAHWTERLASDDWRIWFYADSGGVPAGPSGSGGRPECAGAEDRVVVLDVRGLEPPEPMVRTLSALESLPPDHTLVQLNVKEPRFLLPQLEERGFAYEIREQEPGLVRVLIRRAEEA